MADDPLLDLTLDAQTASLRWLHPHQQATVTLDQLRTIALGLLAAHTRMTIDTTSPRPPGPPYQAVPDPAWFIEGDIMLGGALIHLRHPSLGWLSFHLPTPSAASCAEALQLANAREEHPPSRRQ